jgi:hypothetical protein
MDAHASYASDREDRDGAACEGCGEEATRGRMIQGRQGMVPLCGSCDEVTTAICPMCEQRYWATLGRRTFNTSNLYCPRCDEQIHRGHVTGDYTGGRR